MRIRSKDPRRRAGARRVLVVVTVVAAALVGPAHLSGAATPSYRVDDLGALPGDSTSVATGINASGQIVGWSSGPAGRRGFVFTDGVGMVVLTGPAGRPVTLAHDINDAGVIVGSASIGGTDLGHAVRWTNGVPRDLGTLGAGIYSEAKSIDASGTAVGYSYTNGGGLSGIHAFATTGTVLTDLTPSSDTAYAEGINAAGQIAGARNGRAFRWTNGVLTDLGVPAGFLQSYGFAINDRGQVAGHLVSPSGLSERVFRYTDGLGMVVIGGVGRYNRAFDVNDAGDVVGEGRPTSSALGTRAFLFTDSHGLVDLNELIDPASGWVLLGAGAINDAGQIAAWGSNSLTGQRHALRLTPLGPPGDPPGGDTTSPVVAFTTPAAGATVTGTVNVAIVASDDFALAEVRLLVDGATRSMTTTSSSLTYAWGTRKVALGPHTLTAMAIDEAGNQSSQAIVVTVAR